jgi:hypothetical protein
MEQSMSTCNGCFNDFNKRGEKMNKKLIMIAIVLVVLAMVVAPVSAVVPFKSTLPPGKPYEFIWQYLRDLQTQVNNIQTQVNNIHPGSTVATKSSRLVPDGTVVNLPTGFTFGQCNVIVSPGVSQCFDENSHLAQLEAFYEQTTLSSESDTQIKIHAKAYCKNSESQYTNGAANANYLIICKS